MKKIEKTHKKLVRKTKNILLIWKDNYKVAPKESAEKIELAQIDFMIELTDYLKKWIDLGMNISDVELMFSRINLGCLVESWLRFFYCVHYNWYIKAPKQNKNGIKEPEDGLNFSELIEYSINILFDDKNDNLYKFVEDVRVKRNSVHCFVKHEIGTYLDFLKDIENLYQLIEKINYSLPPIEDYIYEYPIGYESENYYDEDEDENEFIF